MTESEARFWKWAQQVAFMTSDPYVSFDALKAQWLGEHPNATDTDREEVERRLAGLLCVDLLQA